MLARVAGRLGLFRTGLAMPQVPGAGKRVPLLRQMTDAECGAACLAMILSYHGRKTSVAECSKHCDPGRDGLTALAIKQAASSYDLHVRAYALSPAGLENVSLPAVVHWERKHFVVLERWLPEGATIVDPAMGRRRVRADDLEKAFSGVALTFEPGPGFERRRATVRLTWLAYLRNTLRTSGALGALRQVLLASLLVTAVGLAVPLLIGVLVDKALPLRTQGALSILVVAAFAVGLSQLATNYLRGVLLVYLQAKLDSQIMLGFFEHLLSLPFKFFQQRSSGDLLTRLGSNLTIREMITGQTVPVVLDGSFVVAYAVVLLFGAPLLGLAALGLGIVQVAFLLLTARRMHSLTQNSLVAQGEVQGTMVESLTGIETLKALGAEKPALENWADLFFRQLRVSTEKAHLEASVTAVISTLRALSPILLLLVGVSYVISGSMSLGVVLALQAVAVQLLTPLASFVMACQQLQTAGAHLERIVDVMRAEPEQAGKRVREAPRLAGSIELRGVSYRYAPGSPWALRDVSVKISPGQKVALVGRTGSGKSTFAKLLLGLYEPDEGEILYDGIPLERLNRNALRNQVGSVLQGAAVFQGSIRHNIAFGNPELPLESVVGAAKLAALHADVERMPMGYETLLSEGGAALSGGQRQRLALARALARGPALLVLDEATSHLDAVTEDQVGRSVDALLCTRVVIAHRLSTIRDADTILVLDEGKIVECGSHEDLSARNGFYSTLVQRQVERKAGEEAVA